MDLLKIFRRKPSTALTIIPDQEIEKSGTFSFPSPGLLYSLGSYPSDTGIPVNAFSALQSSAVYACVRCLSDDVSKLPIRIKKRLSNGGFADAPDHPIATLLRRPNHWQTGFDFWSFLVVSQQLRGNGYAAVVRNWRGEPIAMIPLLPDRVIVMLTDEGELYYQATAPQLGRNTLFTITPDSMLHLKNMSLDGGIQGASVISCSQNVIGLSLATQKNAATLFQRGSMPQGSITMPPGTKISPEGKKAFREAYDAVHAGSDNSHGLLVLEGGMKFEALSMTAEDAQLLESRQFAAQEIARLFRVPNHKIGMLQDATFSNVEQENQSYIDDALMSICRRIEECLERTLLFDDERDRIRIRFDFDSLLRGDFKTRMEGYQIGLLNGVFSINEVRDRESMAPIADGDLHRVPLNTGPVTSTVPKPTDSQPETTPQQEAA